MPGKAASSSVTASAAAPSSSSSSKDPVSIIREAERNVCEDVKHSNKLLMLKKYVSDENEENEVRMAALHSLRRIFIAFLESGKMRVPSQKSATAQAKEYHSWLSKQYLAFCDTLCALVVDESTFFQAAATRSFMELVKRDHLRTMDQEKGGDMKIVFPDKLFNTLISAIAYAKVELDIDFMIMMKDEVMRLLFCCVWYYIVLCSNERYTTSHRTTYRSPPPMHI